MRHNGGDSMDKMDLETLDERYIKRVEYVEMITSIKKDISTIKWVLGIIAVGTLEPIVKAIMGLIIK